MMAITFLPKTSTVNFLPRAYPDCYNGTALSEYQDKVYDDMACHFCAVGRKDSIRTPTAVIIMATPMPD